MCEQYEADGLYRQAEVDFKRHSSLTPPQAERYRTFCARRARAKKDRDSQACLTVVFFRGRVFLRNLYPGFQSRHKSTLHAIQRMAVRLGPLPDAEIVVSLMDGWDYAEELPVFKMSRRRPAPGVLYPDFTFYTWPESVCPPERSHAYGLLFQQLEEAARGALDRPEEWWAAKRERIFWRGGRVVDLRDQQVAALQHMRNSSLVDVQYMEWKKNGIDGRNSAPGCKGIVEVCKNRYLAFLNGVTYSSRFKYLLLCGSCVFAARLDYIEWWSDLLEPGTDYIELRPNFSDAEEKLAKVRASRDGGRDIAVRGMRKAQRLLSEDGVDCYWHRLVCLAAKHLPPPGAGAETLTPIEDALLLESQRIE